MKKASTFTANINFHESWVHIPELKRELQRVDNEIFAIETLLDFELKNIGKTRVCIVGSRKALCQH